MKVTTPVGKYKFTVDAYLSDFRGRATLPMLGGFMLQSATRHAEERGFGYTYMTQNNRAWVLSRMAIEFFEYPKNDTHFYIETWVANVNRLFTERRFAFTTEDGKPIGYAKSLWACIDLETRKPMNILTLDSMVNLIDAEKTCAIDDLSKIPPIQNNGKLDTSFVVRYSDIDINEHLNSMKYIEHFVNVFDLKVFQQNEISRIEINYVAEGKYGATIDIFKQEVADKSFVLEMRNNEKTICSSKVNWRSIK